MLYKESVAIRRLHGRSYPIERHLLLCPKLAPPARHDDESVNGKRSLAKWASLLEHA
jgi:hypothetical protein